MLGEEKSTNTFNFFSNLGGLTPSLKIFEILESMKLLFKNIFIKPGPANSNLAINA